MISREDREVWEAQIRREGDRFQAVGTVTEEIYVPWGRPADEVPPEGIAPDALAQARAALDRMVPAVCAVAWYRCGLHVWEATARARRIEEKIEGIFVRGVLAIGRAAQPVYTEKGLREIYLPRILEDFGG